MATVVPAWASHTSVYIQPPGSSTLVLANRFDATSPPASKMPNRTEEWCGDLSSFNQACYRAGCFSTATSRSEQSAMSSKVAPVVLKQLNAASSSASSSREQPAVSLKDRFTPEFLFPEKTDAKSDKKCVLIAAVLRQLSHCMPKFTDEELREGSQRSYKYLASTVRISFAQALQGVAELVKNGVDSALAQYYFSTRLSAADKRFWVIKA